MESQEHEADAQRLADAMDANLAAQNPTPTAFLIPSTRAAIYRVELLVRRYPQLHIVGSQFPGACPPAALLAKVRGGEPGNATIAIFSDQLLGPEVASIPSGADGCEEYFSGLEMVLHAKYGYTLKTLLGSEIETLVPSGQTEAAFALLKRYFESNQHLGDAWLVRDRQSERTLAGRLAEAKMRARFFQSAVYYMYADRSLDDLGRFAMQQIKDVSLRLVEVRR